jgi:hypothetical protein
MAFDKAAWDPTPAQFASFAVFVSWILAYLIEFLLSESDVADCLGSVLAGLTGSGSLQPIWTPLLLGFAVPFLLMWGVMMFDRKNLKFKRLIFTLGVLAMTAILILADLKIELF